MAWYSESIQSSTGEILDFSIDSSIEIVSFSDEPSSLNSALEIVDFDSTPEHDFSQDHNTSYYMNSSYPKESTPKKTQGEFNLIQKNRKTM